MTKDKRIEFLESIIVRAKQAVGNASFKQYEESRQRWYDKIRPILNEDKASHEWKCKKCGSLTVERVRKST